MNRFDPNHYSHLEDDAAMIQAAVDEAAKTGATVMIPRHNDRTGKDIWVLPRAVLLHTGSAIVLDNCMLMQADESIDNIFRNWCLITKCFVYGFFDAGCFIFWHIAFF